MLRNISYYIDDVLPIIPDGVFGEETKNSVISFQQIYGIEPTGEVDALTWQKIRDVNNELEIIYAPPRCFSVFEERVVVEKGEQRPELYVVQSMLYAILNEFNNSPDVNITGVHDENSVDAVLFVQNIIGLEPTGIIDTPTYNGIADLYTTHIAKRV